MDAEVRELTTTPDWTTAHPLMHQLRTELSLEDFLIVKPAMQAEGYRLFGLFEGSSLQALAGIVVLTNLYYGRHIFVYDLVTDEAARSRGHGKRLLEFVEELGRQEGCGVISLSSGVQRERAHEFYETKMSYDRVSWNFRKSL